MPDEASIEDTVRGTPGLAVEQQGDLRLPDIACFAHTWN
jgi:hypothetical protein